jgi:hypothetical protein
MSITRISELQRLTTPTSGSLFYMAQGNGPYDSAAITHEDLFSGVITSGTTRFFGSYSSSVIQTGTTNTEHLMTFNSLDATNGCTWANGSQMIVSNPGSYNLQFSAQLYRVQGGTTENFYIWFKKNGTSITSSNTVITFANNGEYVVAAWNIIYPNLNSGDYVEIAWATTDSNIQITSLTPTIGPSVPSVIATLTQI